jgi:hypothetical protein
MQQKCFLTLLLFFVVCVKPAMELKQPHCLIQMCYAEINFFRFYRKKNCHKTNKSSFSISLDLHNGVVCENTNNGGIKFCFLNTKIAKNPSP